MNTSKSKPEVVSSHLAANARRILEFGDGQLSATDALSVERHLQSCSECHVLYQNARQLNVALERGVKCTGLSPSFAARLWERIESSAETQTAYLEQKQRMQIEFEQYSARLRKQLFRLPTLLDALSYSAAILMACYLLLAGFGWLTGIIGQSWPAATDHGLLIVSAVIMIAGITGALCIAIKGQAGPSVEEAWLHDSPFGPNTEA